MLLGSDREKGHTKECVQTVGLFHEVRAYPKGRSFYMIDTEWRGCQGSPYAPICEAFRDALRSGNASKCAFKADYAAVCHGLIPDLNKSQCTIVAPWIQRVTEAKCRAAISLDKSACRVDKSDLKSGELAKYMPDFFKGAEDECTQKTEERAFLGKGLKVLAESGSPQQRELAKAALGQADACATYSKTAMATCMEGPPGAAPSSETPAPSEIPPAAKAPDSAAPGN